jgi:hypothetical protein
MTSLLWLVLAVWASLVAALGQQPVVSFKSAPKAFQIAGGKISKPQILVSSDDHWGVIRAAGDLAKDFGRVTGTNFTLSNGQTKAKPAKYEYQPASMNQTHVSLVSEQQLIASHNARGWERCLWVQLGISRYIVLS